MVEIKNNMRGICENTMRKEDYESVLDTIFCSILLFDEEAKLVHFNRGACLMFEDMGWNLAEKIGTDFEEFTGVLRREVDYMRGSGRYRVEIHNRFIVCNVQPWITGDRRRGTILILHESLQSSCIMQELDVTSGLLQEINIFVESSHDGFLVTDSRGNVVLVHAAWEKVFGISRSHVIGKNVSQLIEEGVYSESAVLKVIKTKNVATVMLKKERKKIIATGAPVFDANGTFTSVVVNVRDITELNNLQSNLEQQRLVAEGFVRELAFMHSRTPLIAHSKEMKNIMDTIKTLSQVNSTVLVTGESGTGKEVIVNQIHQASSRRKKPFIKINCGAIPAALFESELFGYEEGAFTGARRKGKAGFFELANGGTLFLDEIGELDLALQVKLLRVIQEGEVTRIGGTRTIHVDVRIIAATNRDLWQQVQEGTFRQDLFYRLNVINIEVPPLRSRREDIIPLAVRFLENFNKKYDKKKEISAELGKLFLEMEWPGNIRELENLIESMVVLTQGTVMEPKDLPIRYKNSFGNESVAQVSVTGILPLKEAVALTEKQLLENAREKYVTTREMAKVLQVNQSTVSRKLEKLMGTKKKEYF